MQHQTRTLLAVCAYLFALTMPAAAMAQTPYYGEKVLRILRGGSPGGYGDLQARAVIPFLKKYLPGHPTIIIEYMPGAAGRKAANHMFSSVKPDGLTIGAVGNGLITGPILGMIGTSYDLQRFIYLGSTESGSPSAFVTRKDAGLDSVAKLRDAAGLRIGAHSIGHITYITGRLTAFLLELKSPRFVVGYSGPERIAALLRGEVDSGSMSAATATQSPNLVDSVDIHTVFTVPRGRYTAPFSKKTPEIDTFAKSARDRHLLSLYRASLFPRWPYFLPPGTPPEPVRILRDAMEKSLADPAFYQEFTKLTGAVPSPLTGEEIESAINDIPTDPQVIKLYKRITSQGDLPAH